MPWIDRTEWERSRQRYIAWWNHGLLDRPLLRVLAPRQPGASPPRPRDAREQWLDGEYRLRRFAWDLEHLHYGGDAFPLFEPQLGPGSLAIHLGSPPVFTPETVWYDPIIADLATAPLPRYDPNERYWAFTKELAREALRRFGDRALVGFPDLIENIDTLASLRGAQALLIDLVDHPAHVHRFQEAILHAHLACYDEFYRIIRDSAGGSTPMYFQTWGPGRTAKLQCDFSAMISPGMFAEFVLPYLAAQCRAVDHAAYHLDGPAAVKHLELLLSIPELHAIQWVPGDGQPGLGDPCWFPLYRRILGAGRSLLLLGLPAADVRTVLEAIGARGVCISTWVESPAEAEALVREAASWG